MTYRIKTEILDNWRNFMMSLFELAQPMTHLDLFNIRKKVVF